MCASPKRCGLGQSGFGLAEYLHRENRSGMGQPRYQNQLGGNEREHQPRHRYDRCRHHALLETWGYGSYNLRIFPNRSGQARKIEIEIVQGMENDGDAFKSALPIMHSLTKIPYYGGTAVDYDKLPNKTIGSVTLSIS